MIKCLNCDNFVINDKYKYCSALCTTEYTKKQNIRQWLDDYDFGTAKGGGLKRFVRTYLIEQANGICSRCGRSDIHPVTGNYVIEVDHVDGNRFNNSPENLAVLCLNCHSKTDTYKNKKRQNV